MDPLPQAPKLKKIAWDFEKFQKVLRQGVYESLILNFASDFWSHRIWTFKIQISWRRERGERGKEERGKEERGRGESFWVNILFWIRSLRPPNWKKLPEILKSPNKYQDKGFLNCWFWILHQISDPTTSGDSRFKFQDRGERDGRERERGERHTQTQFLSKHFHKKLFHQKKE